MEPRSCSAEFDGRRSALTLYTSSNIPGIVRDALADSLDLPGNRLRVIAPDVGGSFGCKGSLYPEEILLCVAAKKLRRSVKWTGDRLEDISSRARPSTKSSMPRWVSTRTASRSRSKPT